MIPLIALFGCLVLVWTVYLNLANVKAGRGWVVFLLLLCALYLAMVTWGPSLANAIRYDRGMAPTSFPQPPPWFDASILQVIILANILCAGYTAHGILKRGDFWPFIVTWTVVYCLAIVATVIVLLLR